VEQSFLAETDLLHYPIGSSVLRLASSDHAVQFQRLEAVAQQRSCAFCGVASTLIGGMERPADLVSPWREPGMKDEMPDEPLLRASTSASALGSSPELRVTNSRDPSSVEGPPRDNA
jgi:hypothetical protein